MSRFSDVAVRRRNESAWLLPSGQDRTNHRLQAGMRRFADEDLLDIVIVGCGAGEPPCFTPGPSGVEVRRVDAGPFWDPDTDWVSDELGSHSLYWTEPRAITGSDPVPLGSNNSGRGVGGSMVHYAGYTPRLHPSDFHTYSLDGVGAHWPIRYSDLRPHYEALEQELPVSGQPWPWGDPHTYPYQAQPVGGNGEIFLRGVAAAGIEARVGPVAIANGRFGNRDHCVYRGFCLQGCKVNAKASPLITHIPDALAHGAEVRSNLITHTKVVLDGDGQACGVVYVRDGVEHFQRARMVAVAGYSIETPRLLLLSACERFPTGLCNGFGAGRAVRHGAGRPQDGRPLPRRYLHVQGSAAGSLVRGVPTRLTRAIRTGVGIPSRTSRRSPSPTPSTSWPRGTGGPILREQMREYPPGRPSGPSANSFPVTTMRSPWTAQTDRYSGYRLCISPTVSATTTRSSCPPPAPDHGHHPGRRFGSRPTW